jgi:putative peptidoglycan lipid II flippase
VGIAALIWAVAMLLSRVVGLVREAALGRILGGGAEADLYLAAFTIPDAFYHWIGGGVLTIVLIPILGGYFAKGQDEKAWEAFNAVATAMMVVVGLATVGMWLAAPSLVRWWYPGFEGEAARELAALTRIVLPAQLFHLLGGLVGSTLMARDRHALPALAPLVYNAVIILCGVAGGELGAGAHGFAWGILLGAIVGPFGLPLFGAIRAGFRFRLAMDLRHPDLRRWLVQTLPVALSASIVITDDWFQRRVGSTLSSGSIATVGYAKQLMRVPIGVFGHAAGYYDGNEEIFHERLGSTNSPTP